LVAASLPLYDMKITKRLKKIIIFGGSLVCMLALYRFIYEPIIDYEKGMRQDLELKAGLISRYGKVIKEEDKFETSKRQFEISLDKAERLFLSAKTVALAAAQLQYLIQSKAQVYKVNIRNASIGKTEEMGDYRKVSVKVTTESGLRGLMSFLHDLESYPKFLKISKTILRGHVSNNASRINTTLIVEGLAAIK